MSHPEDGVKARLHKLGLECEEVHFDRVDSAIAALACFPMYMVANVHAWTSDAQWHFPVLNLPGAESIREAFAIGKQEGAMSLKPEHRRVIDAMLRSAKPSDRVIYEFALETLRLFLASCDGIVAQVLRAIVARTIVAVARASGEGWFGTGQAVSLHERACIDQIASELNLVSSPAARERLATLESA